MGTLLFERITLPRPSVLIYWSNLSPGVVLHKLHDNDVEAGSCHWIFNWYIFTCFLPRLLMRSWEWYFHFCSLPIWVWCLVELRNICKQQLFCLYLYLCYFFHSLRTWRNWAWKSQSIIPSVTVTCPTWRRTTPDDSSWTDGHSTENICRNPRDSHSCQWYFQRDTFVHLHNYSIVLSFCLSFS